MMRIKETMQSIRTMFCAVSKKIVKIIGVLLLLCSVLGILVMSVYTIRGYKMYRDVVKEDALVDRIACIEQKENYTALNDISSEFTKQLLTSEDRRFYEHIGIDFGSIVRAVIADLKAGSFVQGGSTITQQLAKNMCFSSEKKIERKVAELFVVYELENKYSKDKILELYCNIIYFGENCYGVEEAAANYFGVSADELSAEQAADMVFTIKCPNYYNPNVYVKKEEAA